MPEFSVALTENMLAEVQAAVDAGEYGSVSDALRDWRLRRLAEVFETDDLRRLVREGMDSGPGIDADHVFARLRSRMAMQMGAARDSANAARALAGEAERLPVLGKVMYRSPSNVVPILAELHSGGTSAPNGTQRVMKSFIAAAFVTCLVSASAFASPGDNPRRRLDFYDNGGTLHEMDITDPAKVAMFLQHAKKLAPGTLVMTLDGSIYVLQDYKMPNGEMMSDALMHTP